ncbi:MAG TPA: hypothetical protein VNN72_24755 [Polyangiaceae bacterium]|nr:hypothetical protein [Polyangiaceae bacterium]
MTAPGSPSGRSVRKWLTHAAAVLFGMAVSAVVGHSSLAGADSAGKKFERQPLIDAAWFAYGWGSEDDAAALLRRYAARLRREPGDDPVSARYELAFAEFRLAIIEHRPRAELLELCASVPKCRPEALDELVARLAAGRKVAAPHQ